MLLIVTPKIIACLTVRAVEECVGSVIGEGEAFLCWRSCPTLVRKSQNHFSWSHVLPTNAHSFCSVIISSSLVHLSVNPAQSFVVESVIFALRVLSALFQELYLEVAGKLITLTAKGTESVVRQFLLLNHVLQKRAKTSSLWESLWIFKSTTFLAYSTGIPPVSHLV